MIEQNKERRTSIRMPVISEACTYNVIGFERLEIEGSLDNLSFEGVYINCKVQPNVNDHIQVNFKLPNDMGILVVNGIVTRKRWAVTKKSKLTMGFAVKFQDNEKKIEEIVKSYVGYMRNKQIIIVSKRIIEEFYSNKPEKGPVNEI